MGTLFDQPPRQDSLKYYVCSITETAELMGYSTGKMTPAQWHAACDVTRAALAIQNADRLDEQLAGFGEILRDIGGAIGEIANAMAQLESWAPHPVSHPAAVPRGSKSDGL
jgi:hypothetical protein